MKWKPHEAQIPTNMQYVHSDKVYNHKTDETGKTVDMQYLRSDKDFDVEVTKDNCKDSLDFVLV